MNTTTMADAALALAACGRHVFPLDYPTLPVCAGSHPPGANPADCPERGKHPCGAWKAMATTDHAAITRMFTGDPRNIGVDCGKSGLLVIDEDVTGASARFTESIGQTVPVTYKVTTRVGRCHFYFAAPTEIKLGNAEGALRGSGCNVRGDGGYVVGPGSLHATGVVYAALDPDAAVAPCPEWLIAALTGPAPQREPSEPHSGDSAGIGMIGYGTRHTTLLSYAGSLRERVSYDEAVALFYARWLDCVQPPGNILEARYHESPPPGMPNAVAPFERARTTILDDVWGRYQSRTEKDAAGWAAMGLDMAEFRLPKGAATPNGNGSRPVDPRLEGAMPNLPEHFWAARSALSHIRRAAHSRGRSADLVLGAVLARLSAMVDPRLQFDTGLGAGSLNLGVLAIGPSASGKSSGVSLARGLLPTPGYLRTQLDEEARFHDGVPLGSGEGMAEAYMGTQQVPTGETTKNGTPKTKEVRVQVRRNVFFYVDEGEALTKMGARAGNTTTAALRSALTGAPLGQMNARADTSRVIAAGAYALGLVLGYQPDSAQELLAEAPLGTPQRFLWVSATDPAVPDVAPEHPGPLSVELTDPTARMPTGRGRR